MKPAALLKEFAAAFALLLVCVLLGLIIYDQLRHSLSEEYRKTQRIRYGFVCHKHAAPLPDDPDRIDQAQFELAALMDVARQEIAPTDTIGKLGQFALCSNFAKVGLGGFELAGRAAEPNRLRKLKGENVHDMVYRVNFLKDDYDEFPADVHKQLLAVLQPLTEVVEEQVTPSTEPVAKQPDAGMAVPERWLLVTGADQGDAAALAQVRDVNALVAELPGHLTQASDGVQIYLIRSWRRTVVAFDTQAAAEAAYAALRPSLKYGGYLRYNQAWCHDLRQAEPIGGVPTVRCEF